MATSRTRVLAAVAITAIASTTITAMWVSVIEDRQACQSRELIVGAFDHQTQAFARASTSADPEAIQAYSDDLHQFLDPLVEGC